MNIYFNLYDCIVNRPTKWKTANYGLIGTRKAWEPYVEYKEMKRSTADTDKLSKENNLALPPELYITFYDFIHKLKF